MVCGKRYRRVWSLSVLPVASRNSQELLKRSIKALNEAQEEGWVPNLKEIVCIRGRGTYDVAVVPSEEDKEVLRGLRKMMLVATREQYPLRREYLRWIE